MHEEKDASLVSSNKLHLNPALWYVFCKSVLHAMPPTECTVTVASLLNLGHFPEKESARVVGSELRTIFQPIIVSLIIFTRCGLFYGITNIAYIAIQVFTYSQENGQGHLFIAAEFSHRTSSNIQIFS